MKQRRPLTLGGVAVLLIVLAWQAGGIGERTPPTRNGGESAASRIDAQGRDQGRDQRRDQRRDPRADAAGSAGASGPVGGATRFDFYLLALTLEPAFCEDGNARIRQCLALDPAAFARTPLVLHGLWPENRRPGAYPRDCDGPPLSLEPGTRAELARWMPGISAGLDRHEWRTHGTCSGLGDDEYYRAAIAGTRRANEAFGAAIRRNAGRSVTAAALRSAAERAVPGFGEHLVFMCRTLRSADAAKRRRPHLVEVRVCLDDDGPRGAPGSLLRCADVGRRDQGCGGEFIIDDV